MRSSITRKAGAPVAPGRRQSNDGCRPSLGFSASASYRQLGGAPTARAAAAPGASRHGASAKFKTVTCSASGASGPTNGPGANSAAFAATSVPTFASAFPIVAAAFASSGSYDPEAPFADWEEPGNGNGGANAIAAPPNAGAAVEFSIRCGLHFGEGMRVVGAAEALGAWNSQKGLELTWGEGHVWRGKAALPPGPVEFKFVIVRKNALEWEHGAIAGWYSVYVNIAVHVVATTMSMLELDTQTN